MAIVEQLCPVSRVTEGPGYHFFGYYDKSPWDATGRYLLAMRVPFMDRPPTAEDVATVGLVDLEEGGRWRGLAETRAWNWQQGAMLQWLPSAPDREVVFNVRTAEGFGAMVLDVKTGQSRILQRPIYALAPDGRYAVTLNYSRVHRTRAGYGYAGVSDPWADHPAPAEDGIYRMDLRTGSWRLIISLAQVAHLVPPDEADGAEHWFNHLQFAPSTGLGTGLSTQLGMYPSGQRFIFLHRWRSGTRGWRTRMYTADADGGQVALLGREGMVSHFDWRDGEHVLAWSRHGGQDGYYLYQDRSDQAQAVGAGVLDCDGHCSYSPDRRWILTDTYPDRGRSERTLILYHPQTSTRVNVRRFYSAPEIGGEIRCDLHPRWSRDGRQVCIDSIHEGGRQMYVVDVSSVVG